MRRRLNDGKFPARVLVEICEPMKSGFAAGREAQAEDAIAGIPDLRPTNISQFGEIQFPELTRYVPKASLSDPDLLEKGEVLFNNTNSTEWVGKSAVFGDDDPCCCSNHITRLKPKADVANPVFLSAMLNAIRSTGYFGLLATNFVNQAGIKHEHSCRGKTADPRPKHTATDRCGGYAPT